MLGYFSLNNTTNNNIYVKVIFKVIWFDFFKKKKKF